VKAVVLGIGGLGRVIALELASDRHVDEIVIADKRGDRSRALKSIGKTADVTALEADVTDRSAMRKLLSGADVAVNATLPDYNLTIMDACLEAGCGYVDSSGCSPTEAGEKRGVLEQLALDPRWRERGVTALISLGSDPGLSNMMARLASERFETIDRILVRKASTGEKGMDGFPLYSREIFVRDALSPPVIWNGSAFVDQEAASGEEDFEFPPPIGVRRVHLFRHEEVLTLPGRLGKPVGYVDYKHDINPDLVRAIQAFQTLGLFDPDRKVKVGTTQIPFRDAFLAAIPEPSTLIGPLAGALGIVVEVHGTKPDGTKAGVRASTALEHREANRRRGTTAERFLTAAAASTGAVLIETKKVPRAGVLAPEEIPPDVLLPELESRGIAFLVEERAA
jgi:saccharopine dehydrogenase (NAD+, L-lysine-forming)